MAANPKDQRQLAMAGQFHRSLGLFHALWATIDLTTDFAIGKFLKVTPKEAHLITAGMMFGRKARLLADLIGRSDDPNKAVLLGAFNAIRGNSKRDIITHGYLWSDTSTVRFVERSISGEFKATQHSFTMKEFQDHIDDLVIHAIAFYDAVGASPDEIDTFAVAAFSLNRKSKTSPGAPSDKA